MLNLYYALTPFWRIIWPRKKLSLQVKIRKLIEGDGPTAFGQMHLGIFGSNEPVAKETSLWGPRFIFSFTFYWGLIKPRVSQVNLELM